MSSVSPVPPDWSAGVRGLVPAAGLPTAALAQNVDGGVCIIFGSGGTTTRGVFLPQLAADPAAPSNGETWGNTVANRVKARIGGVTWIQERFADKGAANGYAPLDGGALVPLANIPQMTDAKMPAPGGWATQADPGAGVDITGAPGTFLTFLHIEFLLTPAAAQAAVLVGDFSAGGGQSYTAASVAALGVATRMNVSVVLGPGETWRYTDGSGAGASITWGVGRKMVV